MEIFKVEVRSRYSTGHQKISGVYSTGQQEDKKFLNRWHTDKVAEAPNVGNFGSYMEI